MPERKRMDTKSASWIFFIAFVINLFWEYWHYHLFVPIHPLVQSWYTLIGASLLDALYVLALFIIFYRFGVWVVLILALMLSVSIELWALYFGVWQYTEAMPVISLLKVGLSPVLQLFTASAIVWFLFLKRVRHA